MVFETNFSKRKPPYQYEETNFFRTPKMFYKKYSYGDFSFQECKEKNGNLLIVLRRLNPTYCEICKRVHESENPFITVTGDFRNVVFYCRRADEKDFRD